MDITLDPQEAAKEVGLRYFPDDRPGCTRRKNGKGFVYLDSDGRPLRDKTVTARIEALVIPPAWTDVWICPHPRGHIQATGRDEKGRKQYRYHAEWQVGRNLTKFEKMVAFGHALPEIRRRSRRDLKAHGMPREKVLAAAVQLLDKTLIRVGNDEYAADNNSYGLTTLRNRHAKVNGSDICFRFRGKSGQPHDFCITDAGLAEIVRQCQDLPGQELFGYVDENGQVQDVDSGDVNEYLREVAGQEFSAKDFRTWGGSVTGIEVLRQLGPASSQAQAKKNVIAAVKTAAERLNNRPATCRKFYVHPQVITAYTEGKFHDILARADAKYNASRTHSLRRNEAALLYLLQQPNGKSLRRAARQAAKVC
jgi:DNA topoisomerase-1